MQASLGFLVALLYIVSCASAQSSSASGQLIDGCYYLDDELMGCMKVTLFQCDDMWSFQMSVPVNSHGDRIVLASDFLSVSTTTYSNCYDLSGGSDTCEICLTFEDIVYNPDVPSISSPLNYIFNCPIYSEYYNVNYEAFTAEGVPCGEPGYFSPPCDTGRYVSQVQPLYSNETMRKVSKERPVTVRETEDYLWYLGPDDCIYLREMTGSDLLLMCPVASLDSCALDAVLLSTDGLELLIPLETDQTNSQCIYLDGTRTDEYEVCLQADNVYVSDYMVVADLTATFTFSTSHFSDTLRMGSFSWYYPECGESLSDTCTQWIDPIVHAPSDNSPSPSPSTWTWTFSWSPSPHSPSSNHHDDDDGGDNNGDDHLGAWLWVVILFACVIVVVVVVGIVLVGVQVVRKRKQQSQNGDTLYQMMYVGDDIQ